VKQAKLGISGATTMPYDLFTEVRVLGESNVKYLEIWKDKLLKVAASGKLSELKELAQDQGVILFDINSLGDATMPKDTEKKIEECKRLCDIACHLGVGMITVCPSFLKEALSEEVVVSRSVETLAKLSEVAEEFGIKLAFEFLYFSKSSVRSLSAAKYLVETINSKHLGLLIDSCHLILGGSSLEELEHTPKELVFLVHIDDVKETKWEPRDEDRVMMGDGILPLKSFLKVISKMGYDGPIMVEIFSEELWEKDSRTIVEEVVERFRKLEAEVTL